MKGTRERIEQLLAHWAETELLQDDGSLRPEAVTKGRGLGRASAWAGLGAAYLASQRPFAQEHHGSKALLKFAWRVVKAGCRGIDDRKPGATESQHFTIAPLLETYELLRPTASPRDRERFDGRFRGLLEKLAAALEPRFRAQGMNDMALGTGLNHTLCWAALLWQGGALFGGGRWKRLALRWAHRVAESQDESGYVSENEGPSVLYDSLTLEALGKLHFRSGDATVGECRKRLARFLIHCVYPNLRSVETFDERGRGTPFFAQHAAGFLSIPEGRRLLERVVERGWELARAGMRVNHLVGPLAMSLIYWQDTPGRGTSAPLPCERKASVFRAGKKALIRRRAPWFYVLSAFGNPPPTHNIFFQERTSILSIYHDAVGRIVGGGNDRAPEYAGFVCREANWIYYCIPRGGVARAGQRIDLLHLDYGAADLTLTVRILGEKALLLTAETDLRERRDECFLNLQLPLEGVKEVRLATGRAVALKPQLKLKQHKSGGLLRAGRWRLEAPEDSLFVWPHHPYHPYPTQPAVRDSVGFLRVPLAPVRTKAEVRISVTKRGR